MSTEPFNVRAGILDTSKPDRAQAIAEAGVDLYAELSRHAADCPIHTGEACTCPAKPATVEALDKVLVRLTMAQLMTISGIMACRMAQCDDRLAEATTHDTRAYWQREKAEAEAMRALLRAAL